MRPSSRQGARDSIVLWRGAGPLAILVAAVAVADAPAPNIQWVRQFGTTANDGFSGSFHSSAPRVAVHTSGVYVAGLTGGALPGQASEGSFDAFVRKYDRDGNEIWTRQFGTAASDTAVAISVSDSGVYVAGDTGGTLPNQTSAGSADAFLRKYDFDGTEVWTRQFGTTGGEAAWAISATSSGIYVAGYVCGGTFPGQTDPGGFCDGWVRKYDLDGDEVWTRQFGTPAIDWVLAMSVDATAVYVAGRTDGNLAQTGAGGFDAFVRKYDLAGNVVWTRQIGTAGADELFGIAADPSGVYVAGYTTGTLPGQQQAGGASDAFVRRYDGAGIEVWTRQFGTSGADIAAAVSVDGSALYVCGITDGAFAGQTSAGGLDAFVRRYDLDGAMVWTRQIGTPDTDVARSLSVDSFGTYGTCQ